MKVRSRAVVEELFKREYTRNMVGWASNIGSSSHDSSWAEAVSGVRMSGMPIASASALQHSQVPSVFDEQTARIKRDKRIAEAGIAKLSRVEILTARRVARYRESNVDVALSNHLNIKNGWTHAVLDDSAKIFVRGSFVFIAVAYKRTIAYRILLQAMSVLLVSNH